MDSPAVPESHVALLSAHDQDRLVVVARRLADALRERAAEGRPLVSADVCFTTQVGRTPMRQRLAVVCADTDGLTRGLEAFLNGRDDGSWTSGVADGPAEPETVPPDELAAVRPWLSGHSIDWSRYWTGRRPRRAQLPAYPFESSVGQASVPEPPAAPTELSGYLARVYAEVSGIPLGQIDVNVPFEQYGLSSYLVVRIADRIGADLGRDAGAAARALFFAHRNLAGVAAELATTRVEPKAAVPAMVADTGKDRNTDDAIAIVGIAGRYPDAPNLDAFWANLAAGRDSIGPLPEGRRRPGWPVELMQGGYLDGVDMFDPLLFGITPRDAALMDPHERIFLEVVWEALEDAGYPRTRLRDRHDSRVGVFAGAMYADYAFFGVEQSARGGQLVSGDTLGGIANRVSYVFDLHGPSLTVDTMCSSSLVALHLAVQSLRRGECAAAIAGAVNLSLHPNKFRALARINVIASDFRCRSFGAGGDGMVASEAAAALLLKPLRHAQADGDRIHAVIRGSAITHSGRTNGYTVPSPIAQADTFRRALADARLSPDAIDYVEAHGAGTELGDPIEVDALRRVFGTENAAPGRLPIGAVKSNIGHVEAVAGLAGLTKVVLQMRHGTFVPSLHAQRLMPGIEWDSVPVRVQRETADWPARPSEDGPVRRAGISTFGFGGTICDVVVEADASPVPRPEPEPAAEHLIVLSAYDEGRLRTMATRLAEHLGSAGDEQSALVDQLRKQLDAQPSAVAEHAAALIRELESARPNGPRLADIAYTLQVGREPLRERFAVVVRDTAELRDRLITLDGYRDRAATTGPAPDTDDPAALAQHWVKGGAVDWARLHRPNAGRPPRIVPLPSYPFARMRCWVAETTEQAESIAEIPLYRKEWIVDTEAPSASLPPAGPVVCVFDDDTEQLAAAVAAVAGAGRILPLRASADLEQAVASLDALLDRAPDAAGWLDLADLAGIGESWLGRLAALRQLLVRRRGAHLRVLHVVRGLLDPTDIVADLAGARMAGFVRAIGAEHQRVTATVLDVDTVAADLIVRELATADSYGQVVYRAGRRHHPVLREVAAPHRPPTIDSDAAYVVTGATRGIGARIAHHLADLGARTLVLVGCRSLPAPEQWDAPGLPDRAADAVRTVRGLTGRGLRVLTHSGSLADRAGVAACLAEARASTARVAGVVHCAGQVGRRQPVTTTDLADLSEVLEPKVDGLLAVAAACADDRLDFFVLFSSPSGSATKLAAGVAAYSAANAFLDLFAEHQAATGRPWYRAVAWPMWRDSGAGRGRDNAGVSVGLASISDAEGLRVLERVITRPAGGAVLAGAALAGRLDPDPFLRAAPADRPADRPAVDRPADRPAVDRPADRPAVDRPADRRAAGPPVPAGPVSHGGPPTWLVQLFAAGLGMPAADIDPTANFGDLGVESMLIAELLEAIENHVGRKLEPALLLDNPTLNQLGACLDGIAPAPAPSPPPAPAPLPPASPAPGPRRETAPAISRPSVAVPVSQTHRATGDQGGKVAILGAGGTFPGAPDVQTLWANLLAGRNSVTEVPASRWDVARFYSPTPAPGRSVGRWGGFVADIEQFDPDYFGISETEALHMDPAIRLVLESTATCLSDSGYDPAGLAGTEVGVFIGGRVSDYTHRAGVRPEVLHSDPNFLASQVAQHFDFRGPAMVVDSACSSSLVAVQLACRSLLAGECRFAMAGGVSVLLDERPYLEFAAARALSPTGRCAAFDERADGFVPGEGCGLVLLTTLPAALADGERIRAIIESVTVNSDGRTMGMTTPNPAAQTRLVRRAIDLAGRTPGEIQLIEAHGTGTRIGDPLELRALVDAFDQAEPVPPGSCAVGTVKSNLGHLLHAAGVVGLIKAALAVEIGEIPATLNCERPNPRFDFAASPFYPVTERRPWPVPPGGRVAGVSSFGLGGTNAHLIVAGLDPALRQGFPPPRASLAPPVFQRRRLWLEREPVPDAVPAAQPTVIDDVPLMTSLLDLNFTR